MLNRTHYSKNEQIRNQKIEIHYEVKSQKEEEKKRDESMSTSSELSLIAIIESL